MQNCGRLREQTADELAKGLVEHRGELATDARGPQLIRGAAGGGVAVVGAFRSGDGMPTGGVYGEAVVRRKSKHRW